MPKNIVKQVDSAIAKDRDSIKEQKNIQLRLAAQTFLNVAKKEDNIIKEIQKKLESQQDTIRISQKLQNLLRTTHDSAVGQLKDKIITVNLKQLQREWDTALRNIYEAVHAFQNRVFQIEETQTGAYVTLDVSTNEKGQLFHRAYMFKPKTNIGARAQSQGGGRKALIGFGRQSSKAKDESFNEIIRMLGGDDADTTEEGAIKQAYYRLSNTYTEVLFRYSRAVQNNNGKGNSIWWFTDSDHVTLAGAVEVFSKGDLAEAFVSFIPEVIAKPDNLPPYSGEMDPTDVSAFMKGTSNNNGVLHVDNTKGRLLGDVIATDADGKIHNWAVKARGASQMGYQQMIELAEIILASPNPLAAISETRQADAKAGAARNRSLSSEQIAQLQADIQTGIAIPAEEMHKKVQTMFGKSK